MSFKDTTASNKTRRSKLKRCSTGELTAPTATTSLRKPTPDPYRFFSFTINLADLSFRFVLFCKLFLHELFQTCRIIKLYVLRLPAGNFVEFQEFIGCLLQIQKKTRGNSCHCCNQTSYYLCCVMNLITQLDTASSKFISGVLREKRQEHVGRGILAFCVISAVFQEMSQFHLDLMWR